ncbi:hypothetical protein FRC09_009746, partial [Ceratobasidium sp. 395]
MIILGDDKKPKQVDEGVQDKSTQPAPVSDLRDNLDREDQAQTLASLNPYVRPSTSTEESAPPRYEDVAPSSSSAGPSTSRNEKDMARMSLRSQSSSTTNSSEIDMKDPMSLAALEASPAFQPDGRFQVSIDAQSSSLPRDHRSP